MTITLNEPSTLELATAGVMPVAPHPTRLMGDATSDNVAALVEIAGELELVAPYVTGSPGIMWTEQQRALFPAPRWQQATIDQGFTGSPVRGALIRDCETGAWSIVDAMREPWDNPQKTIYLSLNRLPELVAAGWHGNVFIAHWTGVRPTLPPVMPAGMRCVAQQFIRVDSGPAAAHGAYDLSAVFDDTWCAAAAHKPANKRLPAPPGAGVSAVCAIVAADGRLYTAVWDERTDKWTAPAGAWPVAD